MLCEYSHTKSESFAQIRTTAFFLWIVFIGAPCIMCLCAVKKLLTHSQGNFHHACHVYLWWNAWRHCVCVECDHSSVSRYFH